MSDDKLRALLKQIIKENPGADEARMRELFLATAAQDKDVAHEAVKFFVENELRKHRD
jgi:hypothetical protein